MHWQQRGRAELSTLLSFGSPWAESCQPVRNLIPALIKAAPVEDAGDARDAGEFGRVEGGRRKGRHSRAGQGKGSLINGLGRGASTGPEQCDVGALLFVAHSFCIYATVDLGGQLGWVVQVTKPSIAWEVGNLRSLHDQSSFVHQCVSPSPPFAWVLGEM